MFRTILLLSLFYSYLLKASPYQTEESYEGFKSPLMMMRFGSEGDGKKSSDQKATERENHAEEEPLPILSEVNNDASAAEDSRFLYEQRIPISQVSTSNQNRSVFDRWRNLRRSQFFVAKDPQIQNKEFELPNIPKHVDAAEYNRANDIIKKKSDYQEELRTLIPGSDRAQLLEKLLPLFDQAFSYQQEIVAHLTENRSKTTSKALEDSFFLKTMMDINEHPNKIERLITEIEKDHEALTLSQKMLSDIENLIQAFENEQEYREDRDQLLLLLNEAEESIKDSIKLYNQLIQLKIDSTSLIELPYEDDSNQENLNATTASNISTIRTAALAQKCYISARNKMYHIHSSYLPYYQIIAIHNSNQAIDHLNIETQKEHPRQEIIDWLLKSAELFYQSATSLDNTQDPSREKRSEYLGNQGFYLNRAFLEYSKDEPKETVIKKYLAEANRYQEKLNNLDSGNSNSGMISRIRSFLWPTSL